MASHVAFSSLANAQKKLKPRLAQRVAAGFFLASVRLGVCARLGTVKQTNAGWRETTKLARNSWANSDLSCGILLCVSRWIESGRSPTAALLLGLVITLVVVVSYSWYITLEISGLRSVQRDLADRNRKDSLQLLRIQNDLNSLGLAMRDMYDNDEPYPLTAWSSQFQRIRADLDDAFQTEEKVAVGRRTLEQRQYLANSLTQFWDAVDRTLGFARNGKEDEARAQIKLSLQARQAALSTAVSRLLVENNESEEQTALRISEIYEGVQRHVYIFLAGALTVILLTGLYLIYSNRRLFARISLLSQQRSELAQKLISTQESTLRHIARELHDEFGQILTAIGLMLARLRKQSPEESPLHSESREISELAQTALENVRSLSQALHPVILDEAGLESALDWYIPKVERQTRIAMSYEKSGTPFPVEGGASVHIYRVLQEALNNVARHAAAGEARIRLRYLSDTLLLEVEDDGRGLEARSPRKGIGLVAMRERAELLGGKLEFLQPSHGGTLVRLSVPRANLDAT
jgi:signal transduction histidine kinase